MKYYVLDGHEVRPTNSLQEWGEFFHKNRVVEQTDIGKIFVSTVFLGLDHNFFGDGPPKIFETMIFGGHEDFDGYQSRTSTWDEAEREHLFACRLMWAMQSRNWHKNIRDVAIMACCLVVMAWSIFN